MGFFFVILQESCLLLSFIAVILVGVKVMERSITLCLHFHNLENPAATLAEISIIVSAVFRQLEARYTVNCKILALNVIL